ncbi:CPBP family intramembrane metalloprotease [Romboutsia sedimentorum]|uniref:CPBP family intramembrane metalloprotease n=1 Tax=Romboutsia sedimentorum TaxID=1368474 RepID=A0ABT7EEI2_9FIRM|nr:CPBP family intramembrane glutamic endopeptidase [Romboutsia sedimentorum]MDK2564336.1 CPBP family intramembrane metalloprotease [Romboutsia sedimentorum]
MAKSDFFKFENKDVDFPFYNDDNFNFTGLQSLFLIIISIGAPILLQLGSKFIPDFIEPFIDIVLPLGAFMLVVKSDWTKLFKKVRFKDVLLAFGVLVVNLIVSGIVGIIVLKFIGAEANPAAKAMQANTMFENIIFFLKIVPMLIGEELMTIIPFLVILTFASKKLKLSRKTSIIISWVVTAVIFGLLHLPTYNWNLAQSLLIIGSARLVLTFAYIKTKNIWVSSMAHILNDWTLFAPHLFL